MLLSEDTYPAIEIHQFVKSLIATAKGEATTLGADYIIVDVSDYEEYDKEHLCHAEHYNRLLLCRLHYETDLLIFAKRNRKRLLIYGQGADNVTSTLFQRGFDVVLLRGTLSMFKSLYPSGLTSRVEGDFDLVALEATMARLRVSRWGRGRILHPTSASRTKSVDRGLMSRAGTPSGRRAWR